MARRIGLPALLAVAAVFFSWPVHAGQTAPPSKAMRISLDDAGQLIVQELDGRPDGGIDGQALLAWAEGADDRWQFLPGRGTSSPARIRQVAQLPIPSAHFAMRAALRFSASEIRGGKTILTPSNDSVLLDPMLVIRRQKLTAAGLPRAVARLTSDERLVATIALPEGQTNVALADVSGLPADLKQGLPAGKYRLTVDGGESIAFAVATKEERGRLLRRLEELNGIVQNRKDPLYLQVAVEQLLLPGKGGNTSSPFLADALDVLENVPQATQTAYLRDLHEDLLRRLGGIGGPQKLETQQPDETTGIPEIDRAFTLHGQGRWAEAMKVLQGLKPDLSAKGKRAAALGKLCRAMVLADAGLETVEKADDLFRQAQAELDAGSAADRYRVHNEFAVFLLGQAEDRLSNAAFQNAAGVPHPLLTALQNWYAAQQHFQIAMKAARELGTQPRAVVQVNQARQYVLLADLLRALSSSPAADGPPSKLEQAALRWARAGTAELLDKDGGKGVAALLKGIAAEIGAHVDYREGNLAACLAGTQTSLQWFEQCGALAGSESCMRLSGACRLRMANKGASGAAKAALRDLSTSQCLAEFLAERVPIGQLGRLLAGFFDRRAYVSGQMIDLLLDEGQAAAALHHAELVRARGLQALLRAHGAAANDTRDVTGSTAEMLRRWPSDVVALEYYLGPKTAWVFAVSATGEVQAHRLRDATGRPLESEELIQRVRTFRQDLGFQNVKMTERLEKNQGFDHAWQDDLHRFCQELLPEPARKAATSGKTLVVVPHNVLHYFPFGALVTQRDTAKRGPLEMVQPRFLIDDAAAICCVPSLRIWDTLRRQKNAAMTTAAAVGASEVPGAPRLPGTAAEIEHLRSAFGQKASPIFPGANATRANARGLLERRGIVVFASHGFNDPDRPLGSFLLCKSNAPDDGRLTAADIYAARVGADLAVLSACYSGLAERSPLPGDDLFGFPGAFLQGGARTVVAGLWDINDLTSPELMKEFYLRLAAGDAAPLALGRSQRAFLQKLRASTNAEPWLHPYFWAVYTAMGDDRTFFKGE